MNDKVHSKPPSGRRHSSVGLEADKRNKFDQLPPRLQKKFLADNDGNLGSVYNRFD